LPTVDEVRYRIEQAKPEPTRMILTDVYLKAGRISESISRKCPSDTTTVYGPKGTDATTEDIDGHEAVIFRVKTAKRNGKERLIALPTETEPWAKPLFEYYKQAKDKAVFPFTRQFIWTQAKEIFKGFTYPITSYKIKSEAGQLELVKEHHKRFTLHGLRHVRATELVRFYHFRAEDLAAYCGWKLSTVTKSTSVMERYIDLGAYLEYFPKLLKRRV
jgi:hypothetical protein